MSGPEALSDAVAAVLRLSRAWLVGPAGGHLARTFAFHTDARALGRPCASRFGFGVLPPLCSRLDSCGVLA